MASHSSLRAIVRARPWHWFWTPGFARGARGWSTLATALFAALPSYSQTIAFPGAEGFGRYTEGGRGGAVVEVTNLEDSGPGSLRDALENKKGPRTVVFRVSGTIALRSELSISGQSHITIAGQTAPGGGICLRNYPLFITGSSHIVVRYLRFRLGDESRHEGDAVSVKSSSNIIFDHCSMSWSTDSVFDLTKETGKVTVQWCILSEALRNSVHGKGDHSMAAGWDGKGGGGSYHHNLLASCNSRMPRVDKFGDPDPLVDMRNNVIYNWGGGRAYGGENANMNFIGNYLKHGPDSGPKGWVFQNSGGRIYVRGNYVDGYPEVTADNTRGTSGTVPTEFEAAPVVTQDAQDAYESVLAEVGASLVRDAVDGRIVEEVRTRTGKIIDSQKEVGGWPELATGSPPPDRDHDGMPDAWETARGLNPDDPADGNGDPDGDGYTRLEDYLNGLVKPPATVTIAVPRRSSGRAVSFGGSPAADALGRRIDYSPSLSAIYRIELP